jgi:hypothetical protein
VQLGDRIDLARAIVDAAKSEKMPIRGVLGEWQLSKPVWDLLCADGCLRETVASKEVFYRLNLAGSVAAVSPVASVADVRMLTGRDHDLWEPVCVAFQHETGEPLIGSLEERKAAFERSSALGHWWAPSKTNSWSPSQECIVSPLRPVRFLRWLVRTAAGFISISTTARASTHDKSSARPTTSASSTP